MGLADTFKSIWVCKGAIEGALGKYFRLADTLKSVSVIYDTKVLYIEGAFGTFVGPADNL